MLFMLAIYIFKILCVFLFVVYCVVTFLMVMITAKGEILQSDYPLKIYVDEKLGVLTKKLSETEHPRSHYEIRNADKVLTDLENKTSNYRDRYRTLMSELKKDVRKIEGEVKTLQNHISILSLRREALRSEVIKQQEDYQMMLSNFTKELESKKSMFSLVSVNSTKPRISCRPIK
ncbi:uncharacterized protein LOC143214997 isoform X4 [Lasioglossum baleicum]|uniref:uncharacterized protein LOC143214997 isoform X4 n=1 Tax=Lasioglossum baleicum TaxID=434251 RepID=UPI003FCD7FC1